MILDDISNGGVTLRHRLVTPLLFPYIYVPPAPHKHQNANCKQQRKQISQQTTTKKQFEMGPHCRRRFGGMEHPVFWSGPRCNWGGRGMTDSGNASRFGHPFFRAFSAATGVPAGQSREFEDLGEEYKYVREVSGLTADQLRVEVRGSMLSIKGKAGEGEDMVEVDLSFVIPADVASECIMAELQGKRLTVILPKAEARTIEVKTVEEPQSEPEIEAEEWELENWGSEYRIQRNAQGVTPDDISVDVTDGKVLVMSRKPGAKWAGTFKLPSDAPVDAIFADIENDLLTVVFPKSQGRTVSIVARARGGEGPSATGGNGDGQEGQGGEDADMEEGFQVVDGDEVME